MNHWGLQAVFTNISERMFRSQWIPELNCDMMPSVQQILEISSEKWKRLGTTVAQPPSGRPCKLTDAEAQVYFWLHSFGSMWHKVWFHIPPSQPAAGWKWPRQSPQQHWSASQSKTEKYPVHVLICILIHRLLSSPTSSGAEPCSDYCKWCSLHCETKTTELVGLKQIKLI